MTQRSTDALVIGGGLLGLACAHELAGAGMRVTLLERATCGAEASSAAAGLLQPFAEVPEPGPYLDACCEALELWPAWLERIRSESGLEVELSDWGTLFVAFESEATGRFSSESRQWVDDMRQALADFGEPFETLRAEQTYRLLPQLAPGAAGGLHLRRERRVHNVLACRAAAEACRRAGVELLEHAPVERVELRPKEARVESPRWTGRAGRVVLTAGAWSGGIEGLAEFPVRPRRGQILLYRGCAWDWTGCLRAGRRYAVRRGDDELLIGSTVEDVGFDKSTTPEALAALRAFAETLLPPLRDLQPAGAWAGLRPGSADDLPLLGRWRETPLWLATGHFRSGILLAPWSAHRLTGWLTGSTGEGENPFSPDRFETVPRHPTEIGGSHGT